MMTSSSERMGSSGNDRTREQGDRFIPCRSAMNMDFARCMLTETRKEKAKGAAVATASQAAYRKLLREALLENRTRILAFKPKSPAPPDCGIFADQVSSHGRYIAQLPEPVLLTRGLIDHYYLNLLDWGSNNILAVALGGTVCLLDDDGSASELTTVEEDIGPVTSVSWAPDGRHLALGLNSSDVQLWDTFSGRLLRTLRGAHQSRVGSLSWNNNILTTGGMDGMVVNNDLRARSHILHTYRGHRRDVCSLKWSGSGKRLASGGSDSLVHIWDLAMAHRSSYVRAQQPWLHRFEDHVGDVRALAWCPFQNNLLASGGGDDDHCIKFWNTHAGTCLNSVDTGSQVCALLWNKNERELLSSHGFVQKQLALWKYPSMVKLTELACYNTSQVLYMAQSPNGCTVASAGNEKLMYWNVFGDPKVTPKTAKADNPILFNSFNHIR